jgi:hypothetical protein
MSPYHHFLAFLLGGHKVEDDGSDAEYDVVTASADEDEDDFLVDSDDEAASPKRKAKVPKGRAPKAPKTPLAAKTPRNPTSRPTPAPKAPKTPTSSGSARTENGEEGRSPLGGGGGNGGEGRGFLHEAWEWYVNPRDASGKAKGEVGYDRRTLIVPENFLMDQTPAQVLDCLFSLSFFFF